MPHFVVEGCNICYDDFGNGNALVFIHGATLNSGWWSFFVPRLRDRYRTISLDVRGHGESCRLKDSSSIRRFTDDVYQLLRHLNIEKAVFIGHSMGGMISLDLCLNHPKTVHGLVLVATAAKSSKMSRARIEFLNALAKMGIISYEKEVEKNFRKMFLPSTPKGIVDWAIKGVVELGREGFMRIMRSLSGFDVEDRLKDIRAPALIIVGEKDPLAQASGEMHERIPRSRLIVTKDCKHTLILDKPEEVASHIVSFLEEIDW